MSINEGISGHAKRIIKFRLDKENNHYVMCISKLILMKYIFHNDIKNIILNQLKNLQTV